MRRSGYMQGLRKGRLAAFVALYALILEIFFGAMHAAALAASAFGPPKNPDSFLFQICTPSGITSVRVSDSTDRNARSEKPAPSSRGSASDFCPVCGSAAVSLFALAAPVSVPPVAQTFSGILVPEQRRSRSLTAWRAQRIRAPPLS